MKYKLSKTRRCSESKFKKCDDLYRAYLKKKRGLVCELCGKPQAMLSFPLSVFHILSKSVAPRLRYDEINTLIACWTKGQSRCCHNVFHNSGFGEWHDRRKKEIEKRICELRGYSDYEELKTDLRLRNRIAKKLDLKMIEAGLKKEAENA